MRNSKWLESYTEGLIFSHKIKLYFVLISVQELKKQQSQNVSEEEAALRIQKGMVLFSSSGYLVFNIYGDPSSSSYRC